MIFIITAVLCAASIIGTNIALTNIIRQQFIDKAEMRKVANIDALTHVKNKRALFGEEEQLDREIREGTANFALVMIDMNNMKTINDPWDLRKPDFLKTAWKNCG